MGACTPLIADAYARLFGALPLVSGADPCFCAGRAPRLRYARQETVVRVGISPKLALRPMAGVTLLSGPIVNRVSELVMAGVQSSKFAEDLPIASAILLRGLVI